MVSLLIVFPSYFRELSAGQKKKKKDLVYGSMFLSSCLGMFVIIPE